MRLRRPLPFLFASALCTSFVGCGADERPVPAVGPIPTAPATRENTTGPVSIAGTLAEATYSALDAGTIQDVFDGDRGSLARTENATTAVIDLVFPEVREAGGLAVITGTMDVGIDVTLTPVDESDPLSFHGSLLQQDTEPTVNLDFGRVRTFKRARIEITNLNGGDGHIHIYEVVFR